MRSGMGVGGKNISKNEPTPGGEIGCMNVW